MGHPRIRRQPLRCPRHRIPTTTQREPKKIQPPSPHPETHRPQLLRTKPSQHHLPPPLQVHLPTRNQRRTTKNRHEPNCANRQKTFTYVRRRPPQNLDQRMDHRLTRWSLKRLPVPIRMQPTQPQQHRPPTPLPRVRTTLERHPPCIQKIRQHPTHPFAIPRSVHYSPPGKPTPPTPK